MERRSKRQRQLCISVENAKKARKQQKIATEPASSSSETLTTDLIQEMETRNTASSETTDEDDPTFDPVQELIDNPELKLEQFLEDWLISLDREDKISLGLFLTYNLERVIPKMTSSLAAEYAATMMDKSERTIRNWHSDFAEHGEIPENKQGRYQRDGIIWSSEDLNKSAAKYIRENCNIKGQPNLTCGGFCSWVNEDLLPNSCLAPGFPRKTSIETARQWMHHLGFEVLSAKKGAYFDGHEPDDVIEARHEFIKKMIEVGYLHPDQAPTPEAQRAFPATIPLPPMESREKTVVIFHDESTFSANDDQTVQWGVRGEGMLRPKSKGSGIMVSDFVDEHIGYLALTDSQYAMASERDITITQSARRTLEYGESRGGYWTCDKFMMQMEVAVKIADIRYPKSDGWKVIWVFDQSSCHTAMAEDALIVSKMNVKPGGNQPKMRDTTWNGKEQRMVYSLGLPKGMRQVLKERGYNADKMNADEMRNILSNHDDFKSEKPRLILYIEDKGHTALFLPKFHPELNPIERVWCQGKRYAKAHCKYNIVSLRKNIDPSLDVVTLENIKKFNRKARDYLFAYIEGFAAGPKLEEHIKLYKSHRKIGIHS